MLGRMSRLAQSAIVDVGTWRSAETSASDITSVAVSRVVVAFNGACGVGVLSMPLMTASDENRPSNSVGRAADGSEAWARPQRPAATTARRLLPLSRWTHRPECAVAEANQRKAGCRLASQMRPIRGGSGVRSGSSVPMLQRARLVRTRG